MTRGPLILLALAAAPAVAGAQDDPLPVPAVEIEVLDAEVVEAPAAPRDKMLETAQRRAVELLGIRSRLLLGDVAIALDVPPETLEPFHAVADVAIDEFCAANPAAYAQQQVFWGGARPIAYPTFAELLASVEWQAVVANALDDAQRAALAEVLAERDRALRDALAELVVVRSVRGLCLDEAGTELLLAHVDEVVEQVLDDGLVQGPMILSNGETNDELQRLLHGTDFREALTGARRVVFLRLARGERSVEDDLLLEAEFHLASVQPEQVDEARALLHGCAASLARRNEIRQHRQAGGGLFAPWSDLAEAEFWNKAVRAVLEVPAGEELPEPPSRTGDAAVEARTEYLLAILDHRAFLTADQEESLRPLVRRIVDEEYERNSTNNSFNELRLPSRFGAVRDGRIESPPPFGRQASVKEQALLDTLRETFTLDQRDALGF